MWQLGFAGAARVTIGIFECLDQDGSGNVGFDELIAWVRNGTVASRRWAAVKSLDLKARVQASFDKDQGEWPAARLRKELHLLLRNAGLRGLDLIRSWDTKRVAGEPDDSTTQAG